MQRTVVAALLVLALARCSNSTAAREIVLVARGMTFVLESDPDTANPVIQVRPGEQIKLTLRNEAPGLMHDFRIPSLNVKSEQIRTGQSTSVFFTAPGAVGRYDYTCGPHSTLMRGAIEVTAK